MRKIADLSGNDMWVEEPNATMQYGDLAPGTLFQFNEDGAIFMAADEGVAVSMNAGHLVDKGEQKLSEIVYPLPPGSKLTIQQR